MPMRINDTTNRERVREAMQAALRENDAEAFAQSFNDMLEAIQTDLRQEYEAQMDDLRQDMDHRVLSARGVRQLTSTERKFYADFAEAVRSRDPKQALTNLGVLLPDTVIAAVFDELQTRHPLLSRINFTPVNGNVRLLLNTNGYQTAAWGKLCDEIVQELTSGFEEIDTGLLKLSAFLPVCKSMLELGPEWLDAYVRQVLYEALSNGLENGIINGDGNDEPIGMIRQVGPGVSVVGGAYPEKAAVAVEKLDVPTVARLISLMAVDANGKPREVRDVILVVNSQDYFAKVMPATTLMAPDGSYRNDVMPYPMSVIPSAAVKSGEGVIGLAYRYFAVAGTSPEGRIEYSDHYHFLEDERVYLIKAFANGMPMDNNAFLRLDISGLQPTLYRVEVVSDLPAPSSDATLAALTVGGLSLTPSFDAETTEYTAATTNASDVIMALPADAGATIEIAVGETIVTNGSAATWAAGENTVTISVTAADGETTETYTVTVTKS